MQHPMRVLLVHADKRTGQRLARQLALHEACVVETLSDGAAVLAALACGRFDVIVLGAGLADDKGAPLARRLRDAAGATPVLALKPSEDAGTGRAPALGGLLARIRGALARCRAQRAKPLGIGHYHFRPQAKLVLDPKSGRTIRLTDKECAILAHLHRAGNVAVPRACLLREIWGHKTRLQTHTLATHIYRLRRKLERDPAAPELLLTESGGYRLNIAAKNRPKR
ncbi:MAG: DNA-binding response regulator [Alphaproteobacteria bacterium]|nr:MAG: DNA-binding response regulator [Alphaproteobacteria bacterium]